MTFYYELDYAPCEVHCNGLIDRTYVVLVQYMIQKYKFHISEYYFRDIKSRISSLTSQNMTHKFWAISYDGLFAKPK